MGAVLTDRQRTLPEAELAIRLAVDHLLPEAPAERVRELLRGGVDASALFAWAQQQAVLPLIAAGLAGRFRNDAPGSVGEAADRALATCAWRSAHQLAELARLTAALQDAGVAAVTLKGPVLAAQLYGSPALRWSEDADLLVHAADVRRAWDVLLAAGFAPACGLDNRRCVALRAFVRAWTFACPDRRMQLDLHGGLDRRLCPLREEQALARTTAACVDGHTFRVLSPEDRLLYLCYHGVKHGWHVVGALIDVADSLRAAGPDFDWAYVCGEARATRRMRVLLAGMLAAEAVCGVALPPVAANAGIVPPALARQVRALRESLGSLAPTSELGHRRRQFLWGWQVADGWRQKAAFVLDRLLRPNERDCALLALPRPLFFLYCPLRLLRLPVLYARTLVRGVRQV